MRYKEIFSMANLNNKVALVSGASKGIGAGIAKALAAAGAIVAVNYATSKEGADKVVAEIAAAGGHAKALQGDFSKAADIDRVVADIKQAHGKLDILVNNAGVYEMASLEGFTEESFHRQFNLNVLGLLLATQKALPLFGPEGGSVINIGSLVGSMPMAMASTYSATKGAVDAITISLSKELGPRRIRVNSLNPGMVSTEGAAGFIDSDFAKEAVRATPLGRVGQPADIAHIAVFLASDDSYWLTGQKIIAAGGATQ